MLRTVSASQRARATVLIGSLTPSEAVYKSYRRQATHWVARHKGALPTITVNRRLLRPISAHFHPSRLFQQSYLVLSVPPAAMRSTFPHTDAFAASMVTPDAPPVVIIPTRLQLSARSLSIVEHEIVHVNQILIGTMPHVSRTGTLAQRVDYFAATMRTEYEANLVQLVRWPVLYPKTTGLTLDHWCTLRGYASALEGTLRRIATDGLSPRRAVNVLEAIERHLTTNCKRILLPETYQRWFTRRWAAHVATALLAIVVEMPEAKSTPGLIGVARWWSARFDSTVS